MNSATFLALLGFLSWTLVLLVLMETLRSKMVMTGEVKANGFDPTNSMLSPFMQRLARAHANCIEGLPLFGGIMLLAIISGNAAVTDSLALVFLGARIIQSVIHLSSLTPMAVTLRFSAFAVQMLIAVYWCVQLLMQWNS